MDRVQSALSQIKERVLSRIACRPVQIAWERPVCSFTFDDVEASAVANGLPVLSRLGIHATWYVAGGLAGQAYAESDLETLIAAGQDVQCHTHSHYRLREGTAIGLREDAAVNRRFLRDVTGEAPIEHFSYPFGQVSVAAKAALRHDYCTMRSVFAGVNAATVDLTLLRGNPIYARNYSAHNVDWLASQTVARQGWLIFYTHGVTATPDRWSCTPAQLDEVVERCLRAGLEPMTISQAYDNYLRTPA